MLSPIKILIEFYYFEWRSFGHERNLLAGMMAITFLSGWDIEHHLQPNRFCFFFLVIFLVMRTFNSPTCCWWNFHAYDCTSEWMETNRCWLQQQTTLYRVSFYSTAYVSFVVAAMAVQLTRFQLARLVCKKFSFIAVLLEIFALRFHRHAKFLSNRIRNRNFNDTQGWTLLSIGGELVCWLCANSNELDFRLGSFRLSQDISDSAARGSCQRMIHTDQGFCCKHRSWPRDLNFLSEANQINWRISSTNLQWNWVNAWILLGWDHHLCEEEEKVLG